MLNSGFGVYGLLHTGYTPVLGTPMSGPTRLLSTNWAELRLGFRKKTSCSMNDMLFGGWPNVDLRFINAPWIKLFFSKINNKWSLNKTNFCLSLNPDLPRWSWTKLSMLYLKWLSCTNSYCQLIRSYLDNFKFSKIMVVLFYSKPLFKNYPKSIPNQLVKGTPHEVPWHLLEFDPE